jgi:hypothetical protein
VLIAFPLMLLTMTTIAFSLTGFCKLIAQDVAIDSSRFGALADQGPQSAELRASETLRRTGIGSLFLASVTASTIELSNTCYVRVEIGMSSVPIGLIKNFTEVKEAANAICEIQ